jgi:DeoR/GlpR family transcriptional regulator of sugar metabolism
MSGESRGGDEMIVAERRNKIKEILLNKRSIKVSDLVQEFLVSEETIRRDLHQLEKDGIIKKNYGGAMLIEELNKYDQLSVEQRQYQYHEEKDSLGKAAAQLVQDEQIIILDAGSTTSYVTKHLHHVKDLMVISNALNVIDECSKNDTDVYVLGGKLRKNNMSMVGPQTEAELKNYNADFVFLGTSGISVKKGFTSSDLYEAEIKRAMVSAGKKIVLLADHSKFEKAGLISFCHFEDVDVLVTSERVDRNILKKIEQAGVEVIIAPVLKQVDSIGTE